MIEFVDRYNTELVEDARNVAAQIRRLFEVEKILLFGSGARGEARASSDLDIIVVGESEWSFKERQRALYGAVDPPRGTDMLWYTPCELEQMRTAGSSFLRHALATCREL